MNIKISSRQDKRKITSGEEVYKYVHKQLINLWKDSVEEFIKVAIERVGIDTGMSRASFWPLAGELKLLKIVKASLKGNGPKYPARNLRGNIIPNRPKSITLGKELGKKAYNLNFGTPKNPQFDFRFSIVIFQYKLNEVGDGNNQEHWESLEYGRIAFLNYFKSNFNKYVPSGTVSNWLATGRIR